MIAYLIMAHNDPNALRQLILALRSEESRFFVHIDQKVDLAPFQDILKDCPDARLIKNRVRVYWGGWSVVHASLNLIEAAHSSGFLPSRYVLLSGFCFPVKTTSEIKAVFDADKEYMSCAKFPDRRTNKPMWRMQGWFIEGGHRQSGIKALAIRVANLFSRLFLKRDVPTRLGGRIPYVGSNWWALSALAIEEVFRVLREEPAFVAFMKHVHVPDECFFQTILMNTPLKEKIVPNLTYADWKDPRERPCHIAERHLPYLLKGNKVEGITVKNSPTCFVRKVSSKNALVRDKIVAFLAEKNGEQA